MAGIALVKQHLASIKNIFFLWGSALFGAFVVFLTQIFLARTLSVEAFGLFSSALTVVVLLMPIAGLGISQVWLRLYGAEGHGAVRWLPSSARLLLIGNGVSLLTLVLWACYAPHSLSQQQVFLLLLLHLPGQLIVELVCCRFQLEENYRSLAYWQFVPHLLRLFFLLLCWATWQDVYSLEIVSLGYSLVAAGLMLLGSPLLYRMARGDIGLVGHPTPGENVPQTEGLAEHVSPAGTCSTKSLLQMSWPYAAGSLFYLVYFQSAVVVVSYLLSPAAAGLYNVAFVVMSAVYLFPNVVYQKYLLPKIHRWAVHDSAALQQCYRQGNRIMLLLGAAAMVIIWLFGFWMLPLVFGEQYRDSVIILNLLALAVPVRFLATSVGAMLATGDHMRRKVVDMGRVAVLNIMLSAVFIPSVGIEGAAISAVVCDLVLLILYRRSVNKHVFVSSSSAT